MPAASVVVPPRRSRRLLLGAALAASAVLVACGSEPQGADTVGPAATGVSAPTSSGEGTAAPGTGVSTDGTATTAAPLTDTFPGMPPVPDPTNIYSEIGPGALSPAVDGHLYRVYVPNEVTGTVTVIDPLTFEVIATYESGFIPQHVVPSYDLQTLYVLNNNGNTIMPIDPRTGEPGTPFPVDNPYNLYFMPDGSEAIVVAEGNMRLDFVDPHTFAVHDSLQTDCYGLNHLDISVDGRWAIATCEFDGRLIKVDLTTKTVVASLQIDISMSNKADPIMSRAQPQDVRISPDGSTFYIADLITDGVYLIDGASFTQVGFIPTGVAAHGLYPSRDGTRLYVVNRGTNHIPAPQSFTGQAQGSVSVLDFATGEILDNWPVPEGGSPDMGNLSPDGTQLWVAGRYDSEVYVFDTVEGGLITRIPVGDNPHGLTVWPQPGRYSLGHTGNMR